mgnify:CR=1 FL=1
MSSPFLNVSARSAFPDAAEHSQRRRGGKHRHRKLLVGHPEMQPRMILQNAIPHNRPQGDRRQRKRLRPAFQAAFANRINAFHQQHQRKCAGVGPHEEGFQIDEHCTANAHVNSARFRIEGPRGSESGLRQDLSQHIFARQKRADYALSKPGQPVPQDPRCG